MILIAVIGRIASSFCMFFMLCVAEGAYKKVFKLPIDVYKMVFILTRDFHRKALKSAKYFIKRY